MTPGAEVIQCLIKGVVKEIKVIFSKYHPIPINSDGSPISLI